MFVHFIQARADNENILISNEHVLLSSENALMNKQNDLELVLDSKKFYKINYTITSVVERSFKKQK